MIMLLSQTSWEFGNLLFGSHNWLTIAIVLAIVVGLLTVWSYFRTPANLKQYRFATILLKVAGGGLLAFCLLEPMQRTERPLPGANVLALVVDNSQSMQIRPEGAAGSRADLVRQSLAESLPWQQRIAQDFDVRRYAFDERLHVENNYADLQFDGKSSSLAGAIDTLGERFSSRPVAGALLFTDGVATDDVARILESGTSNFPIYPIVSGSDEIVRDISITESSTSVSPFELAPASVEVTVNAVGFAGEELTVRLYDAAGTSVEKKTVKCDADPFQQKVKFQYRPAEPGFQIVSVRAMLVDEDREPLETKSDREVTSENNTRVIAVDRGGGPYRILYVSGRPNWEFKFLRRALEEDVEIDLDGLVRIAKEEPKFSFRDRGVETSNPLLAGFSEDDSAEQYDEPVLLRLGVDEGELKSGFPSVEEDLFAYHAIILDDVEASFFTQQQMLLMREFVSARGGGFMMLGGQESFVGGGYRDTPLGDVLPIYLRGTERKSAMEVPMRYQLSREGSLEPWLRLRDNRSDEQKRVRQMPDFATWNAATEVKPGASILATLESPDRQQPGLVAHRFGRGRAMALMLGDFWRWSMRRATKETDDLAQSWRQMTRWLTSDVPRRLEVEVRSSASLSQPTQVRIILRDEAFKPLDNAEVRIEVKEPDGVTVTATATPHPTDRGVYVADYWALKDGGYACTVLAKGPSGEELEPRDTGWTAQPSAVEFSQVQYNRKLVDELAAKSGGEVIELDALDQFVESLPSKKVPITESRVEPIWHRPWLILLAILCLCGEWGIRRWKGLP